MESCQGSPFKIREVEFYLNADLKKLDDSQIQAGLNCFREARNSLEATNLELAHLQGEGKNKEAREYVVDKIDKMKPKVEAKSRLAESLVLLSGAEDKIKEMTGKNGAVEVDTVWDCYDMYGAPRRLVG